MRSGLRPRWWYYAAAIVGIALSLSLGTRGVVQSIVGPGDIRLATDSDGYDLGDTIIFSGDLGFARGEVATTTAVRLHISGPQSMLTNIPMIAGSHDLSNRAGVPGELQIDVTFANVREIGGGTNVFKGLTAGARIFVRAAWTPNENSAAAGTYQAFLSAEIEGAAAPFTSPQTQFTISAEPTPPAGSSAGITPATKTPTRTARPTRTSTATAVLTATPSMSATSTTQPTATHTASATASPTPTRTSSPIPRPSPSPVVAPPVSEVISTTPVPSPTSPPAPTPSASPTRIPTATALVIAVAISTEADSITFTPAPDLITFSGDDNEDPPNVGIRAGVIALVVIGLAVVAGLVAVVGFPLLKG